MNPIAWHLMLRLEDDRVIAPEVAHGRALARATFALGHPHRLLFFRAVDTHTHLVVAASRAGAGRFAHDLEVSLERRLRLPVRFAPARIVPVRDQWHLHRLVGYVLGNRERHGVPSDPFHEAGSLPDLLGLRIVGAYSRNLVRQLLPRIHRAHLLEILGVPRLVPGATPRFLAEAAAAAIAAPDLRSHEAPSRAARVASIQVGRAMGLPTRELASLLGLAPRTIRQLSRETPSPQLVEAIRLQIGFREELAERRNDPADPIEVSRGTATPLSE